ncbi:leucyl aminopeptidase [Nigerium massiliense]|uniref:leucyl aminopeptidase n=1 Tax=Nigerium massiliense TaxID=1522317 RepID=UPI00058C5F9F|nr:leucyl aminopeptidase [Nigerium massiliense]
MTIASSTLPRLALASSVPQDADVLVIGMTSAGGTAILSGTSDVLEKALAGRYGQPLVQVAEGVGASAKPGTTAVLPGDGTTLVVTGLGDADVTPEAVRRAAANGVRRAAELAGDTPLRVAVSLDTAGPDVIKGAAEGALLASYRFAKASAEPKPAPVRALTLVAPAGSASNQAVGLAQVVADAVCAARDWVNAPANELYPESFSELARQAAKDARIEVEVLDEKALARDGYGGILGVGRGSQRPPRLVRYSYSPRGAKFHLALVGKGITFDSGGLDLKTPEGMYTMKSDMAGAAAVLAATRAIAQLKLRVKVTAYACMAENMPSGSAFHPSDVLTMFGGKTVENANTDAEGRLVLADGIARAAQDSPELIVDVATLTGACIVALGERTSGLMASDDQTADHVLEAAEAAGESFWQLPLPDGITDNLKSDVADLRSSGTTRYGGALVAAAFLREFVPADTAWAHLDIAGPSWSDKVYDYVAKGGTGAAVRTLVALAQSLQN